MTTPASHGLLTFPSRAADMIAEIGSAGRAAPWAQRPAAHGPQAAPSPASLEGDLAPCAAQTFYSQGDLF